MTVSPMRPPTSPPIPRQRAAGAELPSGDEAAAEDVRPPAAERPPRLEPGRTADATRPRTEYWDVATATWRSSHPAPRPRSGD